LTGRHSGVHEILVDYQPCFDDYPLVHRNSTNLQMLCCPTHTPLGYLSARGRENKSPASALHSIISHSPASHSSKNKSKNYLSRIWVTIQQDLTRSRKKNRILPMWLCEYSSIWILNVYL